MNQSPNMPAWMQGQLQNLQRTKEHNVRLVERINYPLSNGVTASVAASRILDTQSSFASVRVDISLRDPQKPDTPENERLLVLEMPMNVPADRSNFQHEMKYFNSIEGRLNDIAGLVSVINSYKGYLEKQGKSYALGSGTVMKRLNYLKPKKPASPQFKGKGSANRTGKNPQDNQQKGKWNGKKKKWVETKNVLPLDLMNFLQESQLLTITSRTVNTNTEDYIKFKFNNGSKHSFNYSMRSDAPNKIDKKPDRRFWWVDQHTREGGKDATSLIMSLARNGMFGAFPKNLPPKEQFIQTMKQFNKFTKALPENSSFREFDVENQLKLTIGTPDRIARFPIPSTRQEDRAIAYDIFNARRKVGMKIVDGLLERKELMVGTYFDKSNNKLFSGQLFYKMYPLTSGASLIEEQKLGGDRRPANYQRFYLGFDKKKGPNSLIKRFLRASKGQYAGTLAEKSDTLWLTEAILNHLSFKEMQVELRRLGMEHADPNAISVLSTNGVSGFLEAVFNTSMRVSKDQEVEIYVVQKDAEQVKDLAPDDIQAVKNFFDGIDVHFVNTGTSYANRQLSKLKTLMQLVGVNKPVSEMTSKEQFIKSRSLSAKKGDSDHYIFDPQAFDAFLKETKINLVSDGQGFKLKTSQQTERQVPWGDLSPEMKDKWRASVKEKMQSALGCNALGAAFDGDKPGFDVALGLGIWGQEMGVPIREFIPSPTVVKINGVGEKTVNDHNDIAMFYRGLVENNQQDEATRLLQEYSASYRPSPQYERPQNKRKYG